MNRSMMVLLVLAPLAGCVAEAPEIPEEDISRSEAAIILNPNAVMTNAVMTNAVMTNAVMTNAVMTNALNTWATTGELKEEMDDPKAVAVMEKLVQCALVQGDSVTLKDSAGTPYVMNGHAGLCPSWKTGTLTSTCKQWLSSCLAALLNAKGVQVRVSLRANDGPLATQTAKELATFSQAEGAYYGAFFGPATNRRLYVANNLGAMIADIRKRVCDGGGYTEASCPLQSPGMMSLPDCSWFSRACNANGPNGAPDDCYAVKRCGTEWISSSNIFEKPITVFRADSSCSHAEHVTGVALDPGCSPCAWRVINELGNSICGTTSISSKRAWTSTCANIAEAQCGDHSVFTEGPPLVKDDSTCINLVAAEDEYCITASGYWDELCVDAALAICD